MTSILARLRRLEADAAEAPTQNNSNKIEGSSAASCSTPQTAASALLKSSQASVRAANNAASSEQRDTSSSSGDNVTSKDSKTDEGTTASESDRSPKRVATLPKLHAITCKKVPLAHLVWAPCYYFKGGASYICARICDHAEGRLDPWVVYPIPDDHELVEYLGLPSSCMHFDSVTRDALKPIDAVFPGAKQEEEEKPKNNNKKKSSKSKKQKQKAIEWSPTYMEHMHHVLKHRCCRNATETDYVMSYITNNAKEFLRLALERDDDDFMSSQHSPEDTGLDDNAYTEMPVEPISNAMEGASGVEVASQSVKKKGNTRKSTGGKDSRLLPLRPGSFIKYYDKIFRNIGLKVSQIVSVSPSGEVSLQTGDVLEPTDTVLVMPRSTKHASGYDDTKGRFANLEEHDFEPGVAKDVETLQQSVRKASLEGFRHINKRPSTTKDEAVVAVETSVPFGKKGKRKRETI